MRRVVITGLGTVNPLGCGATETFERLIQGSSGIDVIKKFNVDDLSCRIGGAVPYAETEEEARRTHKLWLEDIIAKKEIRRMDRFIIYALAAAKEALQDANWPPKGHSSDYANDDTNPFHRTGVMIGSGIGGLPRIAETAIIEHENGPRQVSPFFIPSSLINLASGHVSIRYGLKGPNHAVVTACASGSHAIGDAGRLIMFGDADVMVAGGAEAALCRVSIAGFAAARALSTHYNDTPTTASRPFDEGRDGFVMGEGAGVVVLEEYEHAKKRGAKIYAELVGYGMSGDAHHITAPEETGDGAYRAMKSALKNAKMAPESIDYINAHGTSTPLGDVIEIKAMKRLFGDHAYKLCVSSTKSAIGHLLGAAGSVEAIFSILAMNRGIVPPTLNLNNPSPECDLNLVPNVSQERTLSAVMSNSFGFGGTNASLIFKAHS